MNNNKFNKINYNILTYLMLISSPIIAQETPLSEIFFLDLGIVIEPAKGNESYSRIVDKPSEEVNFKIKKVESGSLLMASSKELLSTLDRVSDRLDNLEKSFHIEMEIMHEKNTELSLALEQLNNLNAYEEKINLVENEMPIIKNNTEKASKPKIEIPIFNKAVYMTAVFAYQREDYQDALEYFSRLNTNLASNQEKENIYYWMADSHQHLGQYDKALILLENIMQFGDLRIDDALVQKGLLHRKLGDENLALAAFNDVVLDHPESEYLRLAQMEIKKIDKQ